jgi:hypothetical protein
MPDNLGPLSLSKREHFAALLLAGMCANPDFTRSVPIQAMANHAIRQAESLIEMLNGGHKSAPEDLALDDLRKDSHQEYYRPSGSTELVEIPESPELDELRNELYSAEILLGGGG